MNELQALLNAWCNRQTTPEEEQRLAELIRTDADARRAYIQYMDLHAALAWTTSAESEATPIESPASHEPLPVVRPSRNVFAWSAMAACIALALGAAMFLVFADPKSANQNPKSPNAVALLTDTADAQWGDASVQPSLGADLLPGRMELVGGTAQIMFRSGAVVDLTGPCQIEITSPDKLTLLRGVLEALVPKQAHGFTVIGPTANVIDLGTAFSYEITDGGIANVACTEGRIQLVPRHGSPVALKAGDVGTVSNPAGSPTLMKLDVTLGADRAASLVGLAQQNVTPGFDADPTTMIVGVSGSGTTHSRQMTNALFGFDLPPMTGRLVKAEFVAVKAEDKIASTTAGLKVSLSMMSSDDPQATGLDAFVNGPVDAAHATLVTDHFISDQTPDQQMATADLTELVRALYADGLPARRTMWVRLSPSRPLALDVIDRINIEPKSARLHLVFESANPSRKEN